MSILVQILLYLQVIFGQALLPAEPTATDCTAPVVVEGDDFGISSMECTR